jgi:chemotaxis protein MotB
LAIVRSLVTQGNIPPERLAANGLGEYQPLKSGGSEQDKAENRRIELVLVPR